MFTLAHLSDPHLPLPDLKIPDLLGKRMTGYLSWKWRRKKIYRPEIREALVQDLKAQEPDHIALTGDLMNISLREEIGPALRFMQELGTPDKISMVPGNHDRYVKDSPDLSGWNDYFMKGQFPYLRVIGNVALIGLSSAIPTAPFFATGRLGRPQMVQLAEILENARKDGLCRVILIHHPPFGEKEFWRKALTDAPVFRQLIADYGAELILHGHMHKTMIKEMVVPRGRCPSIGVASASAAPNGHKDPASYHLYQIEKIDQQWHISVDIRQLHIDQSRMEFPSQGKIKFVSP